MNVIHYLTLISYSHQINECTWKLGLDHFEQSEGLSLLSS